MAFERLIDDIAIGQRVAAIDTNEDRTQAAFASSRTPAWHNLGTTVPDDMSVEQGLELAHLNREVTKEPLVAKVTIPASMDLDLGVSEERVVELPVPDMVSLVDTDPFTGQKRHLNVVGRGYTVVQARELGDFGHAILGESGGSQLTSLGEFNQGRTVFMSLRLPLTVKIGGEDRHDFYLGLVNHHGGGSMSAVITDVRFECRNTTREGLRNSQARINLRHTSGIKDRMLEARRVLGLTVDYVEEFEALMGELLAKEADDKVFEGMVASIWEKPAADAGTRTRNTWDRRFEAIREERAADHNAFGRTTAYGAFNALTSFANFVEPVRVAGASAIEKQVIRAEKVVSGETDWIVEKGLKYLVGV